MLGKMVYPMQGKLSITKGEEIRMLLDYLKTVIKNRKREKERTEKRRPIVFAEKAPSKERCPNPFCFFKADNKDEVDVHLKEFHPPNTVDNIRKLGF